MKYLLLFLALMIFPFQAMAGDSKEERMKAAIAYEKAMPVKDITDGMIKELEKSPQLTKEDIESIRTAYDVGEMREKMLEAISNHFTTSEIEALTAFYSSPEGQSIMKKMPQYMGELMPYIQQKIQQALMQRLKEKKAQAAE